jgi:DEAD/DEAH box helicase domain-containing protein
MDTQSALALIDESADRPPMKGDSQGLSQGLQAKYRDRITGALHLPGREAKWAPLPSDLPAALASALKARGIDKLYSHQAEAWWL